MYNLFFKLVDVYCRRILNTIQMRDSPNSRHFLCGRKVYRLSAWYERANELRQKLPAQNRKLLICIVGKYRKKSLQKCFFLYIFNPMRELIIGLFRLITLNQLNLTLFGQMKMLTIFSLYSQSTKAN